MKVKLETDNPDGGEDYDLAHHLLVTIKSDGVSVRFLSDV